METLWKKAKEHDPAAITEILTLVEKGEAEGKAVLEKAREGRGKAHRIGLIGDVGTGKSTLITQLAQHYSQQEKRVGVIAARPAPCGSRNEQLGDRVDWNELLVNESTYVRNLSFSGKNRNPALVTSLTADVLDALGYDPIFMEPGGSRQEDVDSVRQAHSLMLILRPDFRKSDPFQRKELLQQADVAVVNRADREGAADLVASLPGLIGQAQRARSGWTVPVHQTIAYKGEGIEELAGSLDAHVAFLKSSGDFQKCILSGIEFQLKQMVQDGLIQWMESDPSFGDLLKDSVRDVAENRSDVNHIARQLVQRLLSRE